MATEKIIAGGTEHDIEVKPLTLLMHADEMRIEVPGRVEISAETTLARADKLTQEDWNSIRNVPEFLKMFKMVMVDYDPPSTLKGEGMGVRHVVGMLVLIVETVAAGKLPFLQYPESFLHPKYQTGLADLFNFLSKGA